MSKEHLPFDIHCIEDDVGRIRDCEELCPGVYYVSICREDLSDPEQSEMYIVAAGTPHLSPTAIGYGEPLPSHPELLKYILDSTENGNQIVAYEAYRYRYRNHLEVPAVIGGLPELAAYGREYYPDYFGDYPAPAQTPWGPTLRYKRLGPGIFAIETEQKDRVIAVCYALWSTVCISPGLVTIGSQTEYDHSHGIKETKGYLFYPESLSLLVLFELWKTGDELDDAIRDKVLDPDALMNAIWETFPEYATLYNTREQTGTNLPAAVFKALGIDVDADEVEFRKEFLAISPDAGCEYLRF